MNEKPPVKSYCGGIANYCTPVDPALPKREWVGLTDEEIYDFADKFLYQHGSNYGILSFGRAVEAKLRGKNS